ncbi:MAG: hypothetical protein WAZ18_07495 [Alphaproteobacteria bacterium]
MESKQLSIFESFYQQADNVYIAWTIQQGLFNQEQSEILAKSSYYGHFFHKLNDIIIDYLLLQISKLHDPSKSGTRKNIGIPLILKEVNKNKLLFNSSTNKIINLGEKLTKFFKKNELIKSFRNKKLSHNDLKFLSGNKNLILFPHGEDIEYFRNLEKFVEILSKKTHGENGFFTFNKLYKNDANAFIHNFINKIINHKS